MPKARDERRERAYRMFKRAGGEKKTTDIARALNVPASTVRGWKVKDGWEERLEREKSAPNKGGAPKGNKNARGNNGGAPEGNRNSVRHGAYAREISAINVQQVRLTERLYELRAQMGRIADPEEMAACVGEIYAIEKAIDRASGRKVRILQMLQSAQEAQADVKVVFGMDTEIGEPKHESD